jgi:hypothetical protein
VVKDESDLISNLDKDKKNLIFRFFLAPSQITLSRDSQLSSLMLLRTKLVENKNSPDAVVTDQIGASINTRLLLKSIGYKSGSLFKEVDFSYKTNTINNIQGKVYDQEKNVTPNIFTVGWVKTGAKGIIDSTLRDSNITAESIFKSIEQNLLVPRSTDLKTVLAEADNNKVKYINYNQWLKVDKYELDEGQKKGKVREKILSREKMLNIALN